MTARAMEDIALATVKCAESWEEVFREAIDRHPEITEAMAASIHDDLVAASNKYARWGIGERELQVRMVREARERITASATGAMAVIRMRAHDEYCMLHPVNDYCAGYSEADVRPDKIQIELETLLAELAQGDGSICPTEQNDESTISIGQDSVAEVGHVTNDALAPSVTITEAPSTVGTPPVPRDPVVPDFVSYDYIDTRDEQKEFVGVSDSDLTATLDRLLTQRDSDGGLVPYHVLRRRYCALSEVMNHRGIVPPRFRPKRSIPKLPAGAKHDPNDTLMMRDRQVIDLHWLYCRGKRDQLADRKYADLFAGDELDFKLAADLATKTWSLNSKVFKVLNLLSYDEWQMAYLRSKETDDTWRNAFTTMNTTIDKRLRNQAVKTPSLRPHIADLKSLWVAQKVAGDLGQRVVAEVHGWLSGSAPLAASTLSAKLRRMKRNTAPKSEAK